MFSQLKTWYFNTLRKVGALLSIEPKKATIPDEPHVQLPPDISQHLQGATQALPHHPAELEAVQEAINSALTQWLEQPDNACNSLVILSTPIEPGAHLLREGLAAWQEQHQNPVQFLSWEQRPTDPATIETKLRGQLGRGTLAGSTEQPEIVVIPNLSQCFLRCIEGLDGIEYLRNTVLEDNCRFWLIGSNQISWEYLDRVFKVRAYFQQTISLPFLSGEQLQEWLEPVVSEFSINFPQKQSESESSSPEEQEEIAQVKYFEHLAVISAGIRHVAVPLFLRSLYHEPSEENRADEKVMVKADKPSLPDLPYLDSDKQILLYSLLLHSELTLSELATSLGDEQDIVQNLVQVLRPSGIIEQRDQLLKVNPVHYPKLKSELDGNNFPIAEEG